MCAKKKAEKKETVGFTLDPVVVRWLKKEASRLERSMSYIVNKLLRGESEQDN